MILLYYLALSLYLLLASSCEYLNTSQILRRILYPIIMLIYFFWIHLNMKQITITIRDGTLMRFRGCGLRLVSIPTG